MTEVKQGNALSPFIFNAIVDSLLEQMKGNVIKESEPPGNSFRRPSNTAGNREGESAKPLESQRILPE